MEVGIEGEGFVDTRVTCCVVVRSVVGVTLVAVRDEYVIVVLQRYDVFSAIYRDKEKFTFLSLGKLVLNCRACKKIAMYCCARRHTFAVV